MSDFILHRFSKFVERRSPSRIGVLVYFRAGGPDSPPVVYITVFNRSAEAPPWLDNGLEYLHYLPISDAVTNMDDIMNDKTWSDLQLRNVQGYKG